MTEQEKDELLSQQTNPAPELAEQQQDNAVAQNDSDSDLVESIDLTELPTVSKKIYALIGGLIILLLVSLLFVFYRYYPLAQKLSGQWNSTDGSGYEFVVKNHTGQFKLTNIQGSSAITMIFEGNVKGTSANHYRLEDVNVFLEVDKAGFSADDLKVLKDQTKLYKQVKETDDTLKLQYTKAGIDSAFKINVNRMFSFSLENFKYELFAQDLRVRSEQLSQTSFVLERTK